MKTPATSPFHDSYALLLAHLAMSDCGLHVQEELLLKHWIGGRKGCRTTRKQVHLILQDDPGAIPLSKVLKAVPLQDHKDAVLLALAVACIDGFLDICERSMVDDICDFWSLDGEFIDKAILHAETLIHSNELSGCSHVSPLTHAILSQSSGRLARRAMKAILSLEARAADNGHSDDQRSLFDSRQYQHALGDIAYVATSDLKIAERVLKGVLRKTDKCRHSVSQAMESVTKSTEQGEAQSSKRAAEVKDIIGNLRDSLETDIVSQAHALRHSLVRRQRTASKFTIVFAGKSKAGKSTLHSIIRGAGWDSIGEGAQRTTRVNRIYEWNGIRLIDTPGMGVEGAEPDKEKAISVLGEADIVCFVLTGFNQQLEELEFLGEVRKAGKPVIIVLNMQGNVYRRCVRVPLLSPSADERAKRKQDIGDHCRRIRTHAKRYYGNSFFDIVPVQLHAARVAQEHPEDPDADSLLTASGIENFLTYIQNTISRDGTIRCSQTMLGSTSARLVALRAWSVSRKDEINSIDRNVKVAKRSLPVRLRDARDSAVLETKQQMEHSFADLQAQIPRFSDTHARKGTKDVGRAWDSIEKPVLKRAEACLNNGLDKYNSQAEQVLEELHREMQLAGELSTSIPMIKGKMATDRASKIVRYGQHIIAGLVGVLLIDKIAIAIGAALVVEGLGWALKRLFKSKEKQIAENKKRITQQLRMRVSKLRATHMKAVTKNIDKACNTHIDLCVRLLSTLVAACGGVSRALEAVNRQASRGVSTLDTAYAARVVNWLEKAPVGEITMKAAHRRILRVDRETGRHLHIWVREPCVIKQGKQSIRRVLQEQLVVQEDTNEQV